MKFFSRWFIVRNKWPQFLHQVRRSYVSLFRHIRYIVSFDFSRPQTRYHISFYAFHATVKSRIHPLSIFFFFLARTTIERVPSSRYNLSIPTSRPFLCAHGNHFHTIKRSCRAKVKRVPFLNSNLDISGFIIFSIIFFSFFFTKISRHLALSFPHFPFVYRFYPYDKKFDYQYSLCNDDDIFYRNGGVARSTIIKTIDEVNETRDQAFRNSKSFIYISGSDTLVTKLPCVQLHSNGKQRIRRMVKYRGSLALSHISISTLRFFHEIRFKHDGWFHVTIEQRDERTTYPRCFVLFLSFRYFRLIIFRATVSYTRIREFHRTNSHYSHETKIWTVSCQSFFLSSWTWKSFFGILFVKL